MSSEEKIAAFLSISNLTGEMVETARAGEWDKLEILEQRCAVLVAQLKAAPPVQLTIDMQQQKVELIHKILADDAEIRKHTEPWMKSVQTLLGNAGMARRVNEAYDTHT